MTPAIEHTTRKSERLEARISAATKALCQEAAMLEGCSLTEFIVHSAEEAAKRTIRDRTVIELSQRDQEIFVNALLNPPPPNARLREAAKRYKEAFGR